MFQALNEIKTKNYIRLSIQQLFDCDEMSMGCEGGFIDYTFEYLTEIGCITEEDYPYIGYEDICKYDPSKDKIKLKD